jgi:hypothetical protein
MKWFSIIAMIFLLGITPLMAQDGTDPQLPETIFLTLSALVVPLVAVAKDGLLAGYQEQLGEKRYGYVVRLISLLIGVCVAILAGNSANLADALGIVGIPPLIGIIAGGVLIGFGSNWIHKLFKLWRAGAEWLKYKAPTL